MNLDIIFIKQESTPIEKRSSYEYIKKCTPVETTYSLAEALKFNLKDSKDLEDQAEDLGAIIEEYVTNTNDLNIDLGVIDPKDENVICAFIILESKTGITLSLKKGIDKDIEDLIKAFSRELAPYLADIVIGLAASKHLKSILKDAEDDTEPVKGTTAEDELESAIHYIQSKTKASLCKPKETLKDYVCEDNLKEELSEIVDFFDNYDTYVNSGVSLPTGILFKGLPGTGKTYAARCIAGTADCLFLSCTASALQGQYIGSGAQNIRELFNAAKVIKDKLNKGVIIFIDELDSLGSRANRNNSSSGEEDRTLNQLLAEMSGFEENEKIMVLGATNYPDRIDDALLRSGRFSRQINIEYPNEEERLHLIKYYFSKLKFPLEDDLSEDVITEITDGLSPADIKELSNEVGIMSVRQKLSNITLANVNEAINKIITKNIRSTDDVNMDYTLIAAHESGHVLAEIIYNDTTPIKVTNYSYGNAGGFTQSTFRLEGILPQDKFTNEIKILLGGRAAENVFCGIITNGASNDLEKAKYIMKRYYETYLFDKYDISKIDQIVQDSILELYDKVCEDFAQPKNYDILKQLTDALSKNRVLYKRDIISICASLKFNKGEIL